MLHRLVVLLLALCWPANLFAGQVVLTTVDGSLRIEGELLSFDGEFFRVETTFGALTLDGGNLRCEGEGCPDADALVARAVITGPTGMVHNLMPPLLEVFAEREGLAFRSLFLGDDKVTWEFRDEESGALLGAFQGIVSEGNSVELLNAGDAT